MTEPTGPTPTDQNPESASGPVPIHGNPPDGVEPQQPVALPPEPVPSFRPPDERPRHDPRRLAEQGIHEYQSQRLVLYTDIEAETARTLPPVIDLVFAAWEEYFGPLPPARDGSEYQLTGYLMRDQDRFRLAGLLPVTLPEFAHGKHDAQQFWMNDSEYEYYRRHLMIHEATHCFMQSMGGTTADVPVWYLEGMAELFATHSIGEDGNVEFRVMPDEKEDFVGFGRIPMIQRAVASGRLLTLNKIARLQPGDFVNINESYAWAWGLCAFAGAHPRYKKSFQELGRVYVDEGFAAADARLFGPVVADLAAEWELFARHLCYGFDVAAAAIEFEPGESPTNSETKHESIVSAARGWQSSGWAVMQGSTYSITADGRVVLAVTHKPWESEPQGISIRYSEGRPIGLLLGCVISEPDPQTGRRRISEVLDIGRSTDFTVPFNGTLYLRVNDFWNELSDNTGSYDVTVTVRTDGN